MRVTLFCSTLLLALMANSAGASLQLQLADQPLSDAQRHASQTLIDEALEKLPPTLTEQLDRRIQVRWQDNLPAQVYGRVTRLNRIELNAQLLPSLVDGTSAQQPTERAHGSVRQELLATLIHEIAHLYDRARLWPESERRLILDCQHHAKNLGLGGLPERCHGQTQRRFTLSDNPLFLDAAGWPQQVGKRGAREAKNRHIARSPDAYELSNAREFFAVNLEYFLLDLSYSCRRPSLAKVLQEHFNWQPQHSWPCAPSLAYLNAGRDFTKQPLAWLDPARVYQVDYLLAEANQQLMSRWGHSMLRVVMCAPGRELGPDCRLDLEHHVVLSFRAFVDDVQLSSWDGLTGAYPSRLFVLPLQQVIDEYTKTELRSLASVPLQLGRDALEHLVVRALEQHWSYDGRYYFVSNNCAVETLKLLRAGSTQPALQSLDSILPNGLLELLGARQLADMSVLDNPREALRLGYRFDSYRDRYQAMFEVLQTQLSLPYQHFEQWLALPADSRKPWFAQANLRTSAALLLLEQAALRQQTLLAQDELKQQYLSARSYASTAEQANAVLEEILANSGFLSQPAELLPKGYGLPQPTEWQQLEDSSQTRQQQLRLLSDSLDHQVRQLLSQQRLAELEAGEQNIADISLRLRQLHQQSGGLTL